MILAELAQEAGIPDGVLQVVHGAAPTVNALLDAPEVRALSFVGGDKAGTYVHQRGTEQGKRVQSNMQAKNHCVSRSLSASITLTDTAGPVARCQSERRPGRYRRSIRRCRWSTVHGTFSL